MAHGFKLQAASPFDGSGHQFAVAVHRLLPPYEGYHAGLFFLSSDDAFSVLHLAWHHDLRVEPLGGSWAAAAWATPAMEPEMEQVLATLCRRLVLKHVGKPTSPPYAVRYINQRFDPSTLSLVLAQDECGLTCATFILATLSAYSVHLLDTSRWQPRPGDESWHNLVVQTLARRDPVHAARVQAEHGCVRFRPTDVIGGAAAFQLPATFEVATRLGDLVEEALATAA